MQEDEFRGTERSPQVRRPVAGWVAATCAVCLILTLYTGVLEGELGIIFLVPFIILPMALVVTAPALLIRHLLISGRDRVTFALAGAAYAGALLLPGLDLAEPGSVTGWAVVLLAGATGGLVWYYVEFRHDRT